MASTPTSNGTTIRLGAAHGVVRLQFAEIIDNATASRGCQHHLLATFICAMKMLPPPSMTLTILGSPIMVTNPKSSGS